ncbi:MAG: small multi-drug export protein [Peptostreptococcaceae bacterium]|nr:small multi-drug export protein [Peptostreptococcaceae bacterium]
MGITFLLSMLPIIELRGAIPVGITQGLSVSQAFTIAIIGNLLPVPLIIIFIRKIFTWLRKKSIGLNNLVIRMEKKAESKKKIIEKSEWWGLVLIVAIPLPGTGAWTGSLVAAMLDMRLSRAFPAIALGVTIAGIIVMFITYGACLIV